jgi:hypothetical protein
LAIEIAELQGELAFLARKKSASEFRVFDEASPSRRGLCRSLSTRFDIEWDDGEKQGGVMDLADVGVAKVDSLKKSVSLKPEIKDGDGDGLIYDGTEDERAVQSNDPHGLLDEYPDIAKELYDRLPESVKGVEPPQVVLDDKVSGASYQLFTMYLDPSENPVRLENDFDHEYMHHFDSFFHDNRKTSGNRLSDSSEFIEVIEATRKRAKDSGIGAEWLDRFNNRLRERRGRYDTRDAVRVQNMAMILSAASKGEGIGYRYGGHASEYLKRDNNDRKELFAASAGAVFRGEPEVRRNFPELWDYFERRLIDGEEWVSAP